jgi:hypothetical protein
MGLTGKLWALAIPMTSERANPVAAWVQALKI